MYVYQPFPKWIYHSTLESKVVHSEAEYCDHIAEGWGDCPSKKSMEFPEFDQVIDEPNYDVPEIQPCGPVKKKTAGRKKKVTE